MEWGVTEETNQEFVRESNTIGWYGMIKNERLWWGRIHAQTWDRSHLSY